MSDEAAILLEKSCQAFCERIEGAQAAQIAVTGTSYTLDLVKYPDQQED